MDSSDETPEGPDAAHSFESDVHPEDHAPEEKSLVIPQRDGDFLKAVTELVDGAGDPDEDYCCWMLQVQRMNARAFVVAGLAYNASYEKCGSFRYRNLGGDPCKCGDGELSAMAAFQRLSEFEDREGLAALYALAVASLSSSKRVRRVAFLGARNHWQRYAGAVSENVSAFRRLRGVTLFGLSLHGDIDVELLEPPRDSALRAAWRTEWVHRARPTSEFPAWKLCGRIEDLVRLRLGSVEKNLDKVQHAATPHSIGLRYTRIGKLGKDYESTLATYIPATVCSDGLPSPSSASSVAERALTRKTRIFVDGSFKSNKLAIGGVVCDGGGEAYQFCFAAIPAWDDCGDGSSLAEALAYCVGQIINLSFWDGAAVVVGDSYNILSKSTWPMVATMAALQAKAIGKDVHIVYKHEMVNREDYEEVFGVGEWTPHKIAKCATALYAVSREALFQKFDDIAKQCRVSFAIREEKRGATLRLSDAQRLSMLWLDSAPFNLAEPVRFYQ